MKLLLDENLPHQLRFEIIGYDVFTAAYMGWSGIENGKLLSLAADAGFQAMISNDRGLEYEQNASTLPLAVVVLKSEANTIEAIRPLYPALMDALRNLRPRELIKLGST